MINYQPEPFTELLLVFCHRASLADSESLGIATVATASDNVAEHLSPESYGHD